MLTMPTDSSFGGVEGDSTHEQPSETVAEGTARSHRLGEPVDPTLLRLAESLRYAPSPWNTQPAQVWQAIPSADQIAAGAAAAATLVLGWDPTRQLSHLDSVNPMQLGRNVLLSLGAAAECLSLGAVAYEEQVKVTFAPDPANGQAAICEVSKAPYGRFTEQCLSNQLAHRHTSRRRFERRLLSPTVASRLVEFGTLPGVRVLMVTEPERIDQLSKLIAQRATATVMAAVEVGTPGEAAYSEILTWLRPSLAEATSRGDGLSLEHLGLRGLPGAAARGFSSPERLRRVAALPKGTELLTASIQRHVANRARQCGAYALIFTRDTQPESVFSAGRGLQRLWLAASDSELLTHPMDPGFSDSEAIQQIAHLVGADSEAALVACLRLGYGRPSSVRASRRPAEAFIRTQS